jgi:phytoene synthase
MVGNSDASGLSYCAGEVRRYDRDRFLTALFAPAAKREGLLALYAFNHEIAKTREAVSETMVGRIRLQWWREALDGIAAGQPRRHEVVEALDLAVRDGLDLSALYPLVDAREFDLEDRAPNDVAELRSYVASTAGALNRVAAAYLGVTDTATLAAAEEAGIGFATVGLVRALPFHVRDRRRFLPDDIIDAEGVALDDLFELRAEPEVRAALVRLADEGRRAIGESRKQAARQRKLAMPVLLQASVAAAHLKRLAAAGFDPRSRAFLSAPPLLPLSLWFRATLRRH